MYFKHPGEELARLFKNKSCQCQDTIESSTKGGFYTENGLSKW